MPCPTPADKKGMIVLGTSVAGREQAHNIGRIVLAEIAVRGGDPDTARGQDADDGGLALAAETGDGGSHAAPRSTSTAAAKLSRGAVVGAVVHIDDFIAVMHDRPQRPR